MKLGILSDAHGNAIALEHCLKELRDDHQVDQIYFLGDAVGYFSDYKRVLELLQTYNCICIKGNHDAMLLGELELDPAKDKVYQIGMNKDQLTPESIAYLKSWEEQLEIEHASRKILLVHGSPDHPTTEYVYPDHDLTAWRDLPFDMVIMGHTHRPFQRTEENTTFVNCGSCGLPRDIGNSFSYVVIDESGEYQIKRTILDVAVMQQAYHTAHESALNCLNRRASE